MAKIHVVKEQFSIDGKDYPRGTEISDPALIEKVRAEFPKHVISRLHDAPAASED